MKIKSGFVLEKVGGGYLAVAVGARAREFSGLVRMNGTGAFLWNKLCEADMTVEELGMKTGMLVGAIFPLVAIIIYAIIFAQAKKQAKK